MFADRGIVLIRRTDRFLDTPRCLRWFACSAAMTYATRSAPKFRSRSLPIPARQRASAFLFAHARQFAQARLFTGRPRLTSVAGANRIFAR